jgi:hypothetical protein
MCVRQPAPWTLRTLALLCCALFPAHPAVAAQDQRYTVRLGHPDHVGDRAHVELTRVENSRWQTFEDETLRYNTEQTSGAKVVGDLEVLSVKDGMTQKTRSRIQALISYDGKSDRTLLSEGSVVTAELDGTTTRFQVDGKPAPTDLSPTLERLLNLSAGRAVDDRDRAFGPGRPVRLGDRWTPNATVIAWQMSPYFGPIDVAKVHGTCWLDGVADVDQEPCLTIRVDMSIDPSQLATAMPTTTTSGGIEYVYDTVAYEAHFTVKTRWISVTK